MATLSKAADVLVVGAGPTGLALAASLKQSGISVLIADQHAQGANTSRAAVVHARTLEVLEPLGISEAMVEQGVVVPRFRIRDRDRILLDIDFSLLDTRYPYTLMCPQDRTENVLLNCFESLGGIVSRPFTLQHFTCDRDGVTAFFSGNDHQHSVRAKWIVGCDGSHSTVRTRSNIAFLGGNYSADFILADVSMRWPFNRDEVDLFFAPTGLIVVAPLPLGRFRVVATVNSAPEQLDIPFVQAILSQRGPSRDIPKLEDMIWSSRFRIQHRVAEKMRHGRILLCGDAAHVHSPAGGQGMNTGIQDAISLASPLAAAVNGDDSQLEKWSKDRHNIAKNVVSATHRITRAATVRSRTGRVARNTLLGILGKFPSFTGRLARQLAELDN
ncbi:MULTISPECIES: FAD-dependent monooxygenase [Bradyrhizobium]|uniref:FAD-dependent monooxygenase n=1 Tax=Bradyrhizobium TaxID=374 RepID=UPI00041E76FB|nr:MULTISPECIES: FAD-dependent monooxygenase [Bradyrhizobium]UFW46481.1 FAD-dependent monooxygenase [Bradyrhizobium arachidis]